MEHGPSFGAVHRGNEMPDLTAIRLLEPPIVAVSAREGLAIYRHDDGSVTIAIGSSVEPAETLNIPWHMVRCIGKTLSDVAESADVT